MRKKGLILGVLFLSLTGCGKQVSSDSIPIESLTSEITQETVENLVEDVKNDETKGVSLNGADLAFPIATATLVEAGVVDELSQSSGIVYEDADTSITAYVSADGISYIESIETKKDNVGVLGIRVGVSSEDALGVSEQTPSESDLADMEYRKGFYHDDMYIEYAVDTETDKVSSLYIRYENKY